MPETPVTSNSAEKGKGIQRTLSADAALQAGNEHLSIPGSLNPDPDQLSATNEISDVNLQYHVSLNPGDSAAAHNSYRDQRRRQKLMEAWHKENNVVLDHRRSGWQKYSRRFGIPLAVVLFIVAYILLGAYFFYLLEPTNDYWDSVYWAVVTLSTVGYGDIAPLTDGGKWFFMFYILLGLTVLVSALTVVSSHLSAVATEMSIGGAPPLPTLMRILTEVVVATGILAALVLIGAVGFHFTADLNFTTSIYFTIETLTTVGYGDYDLDLSSTRRRIFVVTYIFFAVPIFAGRLAALIEAVSKYLQMRRIRDMREIGVTRQMLQEADIDLDGSVNRAEFALYFLTKLQIIDMHMVQTVIDMFDDFDGSGDGQLDVNDIKLPENTEVARKVLNQAKKDARIRMTSGAFTAELGHMRTIHMTEAVMVTDGQGDIENNAAHYTEGADLVNRDAAPSKSDASKKSKLPNTGSLTRIREDYQIQDASVDSQDRSGSGGLSL